MQRAFTALFALCLSIPAFAAKKVVNPTSSSSNDKVEITATISLAPEEVAKKIGFNPGQPIALVQIRATPRTDEPLRLGPDDFILLAHNDGQRTRPFEPAQLAGNGALVVRSTSQGKATVGRTPGRPYGGIGGTRPNSLPGSGVGVGSGGVSEQKTESKMENDKSGNNTLLAALRSKQFPEKETLDPIEGYLYFPLEGKHKLKDMAVLYRGQGGKVDLEFEH